MCVSSVCCYIDVYIIGSFSLRCVTIGLFYIDSIILDVEAERQ